MATSKCPKCEGTRFEIQIVSPTHSNYKLTFVQCASCGTVVGVLDFFNIGSLLQNLAKKLGFTI